MGYVINVCLFALQRALLDVLFELKTGSLAQLLPEICLKHERYTNQSHGKNAQQIVIIPHLCSLSTAIVLILVI